MVNKADKLPTLKEVTFYWNQINKKTSKHISGGEISLEKNQSRVRGDGDQQETEATFKIEWVERPSDHM